jgi:hypothetical protein
VNTAKRERERETARDRARERQREAEREREERDRERETPAEKSAHPLLCLCRVFFSFSCPSFISLVPLSLLGSVSLVSLGSPLFARSSLHCFVLSG